MLSHYTLQYTKIYNLPRAQASYNSFFRNDAASCFEGKRLTVRKEISDWIENTGSDSPRTFWLSGLAGIGKSTIAQTVAAKADADGQLGASFFFSRNADSLKNPSLLFPTLAFQLSLFDQEIEHYIGEAILANPDAGSARLVDQIQQLIIAPLQKMTTPTRPILVVIDALDECAGTAKEEVIRLVVTELPNAPSLKILITSRPESEIRTIIKSQQNELHTIILNNIEDPVVQDDIRKFLRFRLQKMAALFPDCDWHFTEDELEQLVAMAAKLFIFAVTVMKYIEDRVVMDPRAQLENLLSITKPDFSESNPYADLNSVYLQVLSSAIPKASRTKFVMKRFQTVVGSIVSLNKPFSYNELAKLLNVKVAYIKAAINALHSVLVVPATDDGILGVYHKSFPDFIVDPDRCRNPAFLVDPPAHHARLARACIECLIPFYEEQQRLSDPYGGELSSYPLLVRYSALSLSYHLDRTQNLDEETIERLSTFVSRFTVAWYISHCVLDSENAKNAFIALCSVSTVAVRFFVYSF